MVMRSIQGKISALVIFFIVMLITYHVRAQDSSKVISTGSYINTKQVGSKFKVPYINKGKFDFKFFPLSLVLGQLPQYCLEMQFAVEYRFAKHQSLQFGISGEIPGPVGAIINTQYGDLTGIGYWFYGGRGIVGYRYYLREGESNLTGPYVGVEVSVNGLISPPREDGQYTEIDEYYFVSETNRTHLLMSNYNFTAGIHTIKKRVSIDVGISIGYRYYYFWRHYSFGNAEFDINEDGLYRYYKNFPVGGSFNFTIGRAF